MIRSVAAVLLTCAVAACGSPADAAPSAVARRFADAVGSGDTAAACALLAPRAKDALTTHPCAVALAALRLPHAPPAMPVVWSSEAQAKSADDTVFLHEFSDGWRITGAGCHPRNEQVYDCLVGGR
ncbi:hypothetical protein SAMN05421504_111166 [Amycolatopsis xylanica]|uniref:Lipoprotein n=1 Tax=Amycolatopsis xylanica TaxID=589385 RepID=A0A1H3RKR2_9PSEU|nr:hypothetical protein [Amycolatopsis xylanica]SDZ26332.1 hypothetical protein SAMN05421504_111166 [Amycolatopsis xylanica]